MFDTDYKKKAEEIQNWLQKTVENSGFTDVVVALSGGIDSAVSTTLAVRALGKEHVHVVLLPYGSLNDKGTDDAKKVTEFLGLAEDHVHIVDIQKSVDTVIANTVKQSHTTVIPDLIRDLGTQSISGIRKGNIMARMRMIYLYDLAKSLTALVIGTENKSEYYLSYFTRFGDEASDIEPIRNLYKTQVWEMGKFLGVPKEIIEKAPSAGLWEGQSDENEFGFSYQDADRILFYHFDEGMPEEERVDLGIDKDIVTKVLQWVSKNDFKHHLPKIFEK